MFEMWIFQVLVEHKAVLTWQDKFGRNAVHMAAQYGSRDCLVTLKLQGATLDTQTYDGFTPMYLAAKNGHKKVDGGH